LFRLHFAEYIKDLILKINKISFYTPYKMTIFRQYEYESAKYTNLFRNLVVEDFIIKKGIKKRSTLYAI